MIVDFMAFFFFFWIFCQPKQNQKQWDTISSAISFGILFFKKNLFKTLKIGAGAQLVNMCISSSSSSSSLNEKKTKYVKKYTGNILFCACYTLISHPYMYVIHNNDCTWNLKHNFWTYRVLETHRCHVTQDKFHSILPRTE